VMCAASLAGSFACFALFCALVLSFPFVLPF
jgi:hypothetical protein